MGIAISELLSLEYFKDFKVVAGRRGLHREIQGITVMDAPDAFHWTRGKELVMTCGYTISLNPDRLKCSFQDGTMQKIAGLMIKRDRYVDVEHLPELELFNEHDVPLISMPFGVPWMEVMSQINTAVINRTIRRFRVSSSVFQLSNLSYKEQKIKRILQAVEAEMEFPAFIYDMVEKERYYSSANFQRIAESYGLSDEDFWNPSKPFTKHTLCDYIGMVRYRLAEPGLAEEPRVSWITIPLSMNGQIQAYFVVMESRELLDYYDEYAIRVAFILLQSIYEQIMAVQATGNIGFENFVHFVLNSDGADTSTLMHQANAQGVPMSEPYLHVVFRQKNPEIIARRERKTFMEMFRKCYPSLENRMAFLEENEGVFFLEKTLHRPGEEAQFNETLRKFTGMMAERIPGFQMEFGVLGKPEAMKDVKKSIEKCQKALEMGRVLSPQKQIWEYETLGPLAWLQIPEEELEEMLRTYRELLEDERNAELLRTLKVYLENNMNFSVTAEKMYVHINTIRKRIDKVNDLLPLDFTDYLGRMKTELLLQFMDLG